MPSFYTNYEIENDGDLREVEIEIFFNYYAGCPGMPYGDPPQPGDDEELEVYEVRETGIVIDQDKYGPAFQQFIVDATWKHMSNEAEPAEVLVFYIPKA